MTEMRLAVEAINGRRDVKTFAHRRGVLRTEKKLATAAFRS